MQLYSHYASWFSFILWCIRMLNVCQDNWLASNSPFPENWVVILIGLLLQLRLDFPEVCVHAAAAYFVKSP